VFGGRRSAVRRGMRRGGAGMAGCWISSTAPRRGARARPHPAAAATPCDPRRVESTARIASAACSISALRGDLPRLDSAAEVRRRWRTCVTHQTVTRESPTTTEPPVRPGPSRPGRAAGEILGVVADRVGRGRGAGGRDRQVLDVPMSCFVGPRDLRPRTSASRDVTAPSLRRRVDRSAAAYARRQGMRMLCSPTGRCAARRRRAGLRGHRSDHFASRPPSTYCPAAPALDQHSRKEGLMTIRSRRPRSGRRADQPSAGWAGCIPRLKSFRRLPGTGPATRLIHAAHRPARRYAATLLGTAGSGPLT